MAINQVLGTVEAGEGEAPFEFRFKAAEHFVEGCAREVIVVTLDEGLTARSAAMNLDSDQTGSIYAAASVEGRVEMTCRLLDSLHAQGIHPAAVMMQWGLRRAGLRLPENQLLELSAEFEAGPGATALPNPGASMN